MTQRYKSLLLCDTVNLCLASPVCPGYQGLRLRLSFVQQAKRKLADKAHLAPSLQRRHLTHQLLSGPCLHCCQEPLACRTWQSGVPQPLSDPPPSSRVHLPVTTPSQLLPALDRHCIGLCQTSSGAAAGLIRCSGRTMQQGLDPAVT